MAAGDYSFSEVIDLPLSILIAEDDQINQKLALRLFKKLGYNPDVAINGQKALELVKNKSYDIIFMDMHMPEMDGLEATRQILAWHRQQKTTPPHIFAMTANVLEADRQSCFKAGMLDFIAKPITIQMIEDLLVKWQTELT